MTDSTPADNEPAPAPDAPFEDLEVEGSDVDVTGGSTVYVARAPGESRPHRVGAAGGSIPAARYASGGVLRKLEEEKARAAKGPARVKIITDTRWLEKDAKRGGFRRAEQGVEGEPLWLEAWVVAQHAPDGTAAALTVFQQGPGGQDVVLDELSAKVEGAKVLAEWRCACRPQADARSDPQLYFKVAVKDDTARSTLLPVESYLEFVCRTPDGRPFQTTYVVTLPRGRERGGKTDDAGAARMPSPAGRAKVRLGEVAEAGASLSFACVDEAGAPLRVAYRILFADGAEAAGTTDERGEVALDGVPAGPCQVRLEPAPDFVEIACTDEEGRPFHCGYVLLLPDGRELRGETDGAGAARVEGVPAGACQVRLVASGV